MSLSVQASLRHAGPDVCGLGFGACPACDAEQAELSRKTTETDRLAAERRLTLPAAKRIAHLLSLHPDIFRAAGLPIGGRR